jgi:hypothetical protein
MDETRKRAYRRLLYYAMLDARAACMCFRQPDSPCDSVVEVRRVGMLANWLHNLASFSARDFEGFDESWFWRDFQQYSAQHPEYRLDGYKELFERDAGKSEEASL